MDREKCHFCGKPAMAYLIRADGVRLYMCLDHFPHGEAMPGKSERPKSDGGEESPA